MKHERVSTLHRLLAVIGLLLMAALMSRHGDAQSAATETLTFTTTADTYVDSSDATKNFGNDVRLRADGSPQRISYLRFVVGGLGGRPVLQARLRLQVSGPSDNSGGKFHRVSGGSWTESTLTFANRPPLDEPALATLGPVKLGDIVDVAVDGVVTGDGTYNFGFTSTFDDGAYYVSAEAGSGAPPRLVLTVGAGPEPVVTIVQPPDGATFFRGDPVPLQATAVDDTDGRLDDEVRWTSSRDGSLGTGDAIAPELSEGDHAITASVTDSDGFTGADRVDLTIVPPPPDNTAPLVAITSPLDGRVFASSDPIAFRGSATDLEDGTITSRLSWASDQDGHIGDGASFATTLSDGTHDVTASVRDSDGLTGSATVRLEVVEATALGEFVAIADTYVDENSPKTNYGGASTLQADADALRITYLRFTVSGVGQSTVVSARMRLNVSTASGSGSDSGGAIHLMSPDRWTEKAVTYATRPAVDGPRLASVGSVGGGDVVEFDVTDAITGDGVYDFALMSESNDLVTYRSREASSGRPRLLVSIDPNEAPVVSIRTPAAGSEVAVGTAVTLDATANDPEDGNIGSAIVWRSDVSGQLATGARRTVTLSPGRHTITASATDADGATGSAVTTISVGRAPVVTILSPANGTVALITDPPLTFEGDAPDVEDGNLRNQLRWSSSRDGNLGVGRRVTPTLTAGQHTITAAVTDSHGLTAQAQIGVTIRPPNTAPRVTITAPRDGAVLPAGADVTLTGTVADDFDQGLDGRITWISDRDGTLGSGASLTRRFTEGIHRLTARVTDNDGATGSASITITITPTPPAVTIFAPGNGATIVVGTPIAFSGRAIDPTDGDLSTGLAWTSDLGGAIGAGAAFTMASLAEGVHRITASAADSGGRIGTAQITITITPPSAPPVVNIVNPADGAVVGVGQPVRLNVTADDPEDGNIARVVRWTSSRSGFLGTGASLVTAALSAGTHRITATASDSTSVSGSDAITIDVVTGVPVIRILLPVPQMGFLTTTTVRFYATADDATDGDVSDGLVWTSDKDGVLGMGRTFTVDGLSAGTHTVSALATTRRGARGLATARFVVSPATVSVIAAADAYVDQGMPDANFGNVSDLMADTGPVRCEAYLRFDVKGVEGLDATLARLRLQVTSKGVSDFGGEIRGLSPGTWTEKGVTFNARPAVGASVLAAVRTAVSAGQVVAFDVTPTVTGEGSYHLALVTPSTDAVRYKSRETSSGRPELQLTLAQRPVQQLPVITLTAPATGLVAFDDTAITFQATASDAEDGNLTPAIAWTSSLAGSLGTGGSLSKRLGRGQHTITASVTDSFGLTARATVAVTVVDRPPAVSIQSPSALQLFPVGFPVELSGTASDVDDGNLSARLAWTSHRDGALGSGASILTTRLSAGDHVITATVANNLGTIGSSTVTIFIGQAPPQVVIDSPPAAVTIGEGTPIVLSGSATDLEDGNLSALLRWSSSLEGALGSGQRLTAVLMMNGTHTVTASATDSHGMTRSGQVAITITPAPPVVTITAPVDGTEVTGPIGFAAMAIDARDGDRSADLRWTSSIDGALGNGPTLAPRQLSPGAHAITASAADGDRLVGSATITIVVGVARPQVEIVEPVSSAGPLSQMTIGPGVPVTFTATAFDVAGQDIGGNVTWRSDLAGPLGTGPSITVPGLILGRHSITAEATDGNGITGVAQILVFVEGPGGARGPVVTLTAPPPDTTLEVGVPAAFAASAFDGAAGDLSGRITWVSNLDGLLGTGGAITAALRSVGMHVVTAAAADASGLVGRAAVTVEAVLPSVTVDAAADAYVDDSAPDANFGSSPELFVGADPGRRIFLRFDVRGVSGRAVERAVVRLQTTSSADAGSDHGGVIHRVTQSGWDELGVTHATSPRVDGPPLDEAGAVVPSQAVDFDVTSAVRGDGIYGFAILPAADETIYRAREGAFGRPQLIVFLKPPVFQHPHVQILEPADLATLSAGVPTVFRGTARDDQDGDLDVAIIWRSDIDGPLAIGPEVTLRLSPGAHVLRATVNDVDGNAAADAIRVFVGDRPIVMIDRPADGARMAFGEPVVFGGRAFDPQEGDLSSFIEWSSDIDGPLAVGPSIARALSPGTHSVTADVTDADGHVGRAIIHVTVTAENVGFNDFDFGAGVDQDDNRITASKPESKLWYLDGIWWGTLFSPTARSYTIHRLEIATQTWIDTRVAIDARPGSRQDALLDGNRLYVVSRTVDPTQQNRLLRFTYHPGTQTFVLDGGFPVNVPGGGTECMTIAKDSTGRLWGAYTLNDTVMVTHTLGSDTAWATPFVLPVADEDPAALAVWYDDIAAVQRIDGAIGVFWSNQLTREDYFAVHNDGTSPTDPAAWRLEVAATGGAIADDHFNMKLASDGRLFVAAKTSFTSDSATLVGLLVRAPDGRWSGLHRVTTAKYNPTRPLCMLDEARRRVRVFYSPFEGAIYTKSSDMDTIAFLDNGIGTPFITSRSTGFINNPTGTKQNVDPGTGLVVLAASTRAYWHNTMDPEEAPEVTITAPADGSRVLPGTAVVLSATAFSLTDGIVTGNLAWTSSLDGALGRGGRLTLSTLSLGEHVIAASVTDSTGIAGRAQVRIGVERDTGPVITVDAPVAGRRYLAGAPVMLAGRAIDSFEGDLSATLRWSSDRDGLVGVGAMVTAGSLSLGQHTLTAEATDRAGFTSRVSVAVDVQQAAPPTVRITSPASGATFAFGAAVPFAGSASDAFDGDLGVSLRWSSDRDGAIGTGAGFTRSSLSAGTHVVTATVTDSHGLAASATVTVTVGGGSRVSITSPTDGATFAEGSAVVLTGSATDVSDRDISASITWISSREGALGTGRSITVTTLDPGEHVVTATVSDGSGTAYTAQVRLTVVANMLPVVAIEAPSGGERWLSNHRVVLSAAAWDEEQGDLRSQVRWTSSRDGSLGVGSPLLAGPLSSGTHVLTATVTDAAGGGAAATVSVTVEAAMTTVTASADAHVDATMPDANLGGAAVLLADAAPHREAFLRFDVPDPAPFAVAQVRLRLNVGSGSSDGSASGGSVHRLTGSWSEATTTFTTRPTITGTALDTKGAVGTGDTVRFDVTAAVGGRGVHDFAIVTPSTDSVGYRSREASSNRPRLEITRTQELPPVAVITAPRTGATVPGGSPVTLRVAALDPEDGDVATSTVWRSDRQGALGTGASVAPVLTAGTHTVTATVTDSRGRTATAQIVLNVSGS